MLRPTLLGLLRLHWCHQMSLADTEVHWHSKHVDLAFMSPREELGAVAIELKVDNTRRAIEQARLNRYLTAQSWAAVHTPPGPELRARAERYGVGLLLVLDDGVYPIAWPSARNVQSSVLADHLAGRQRRVRDILGALRRV